MLCPISTILTLTLHRTKTPQAIGTNATGVKVSLNSRTSGTIVRHYVTRDSRKRTAKDISNSGLLIPCLPCILRQSRRFLPTRAEL